MGLYASIYRPLRKTKEGQLEIAGSCSMNGISDNFAEVCVTNVSGPFEPDENHPAVILEDGPYGTVRAVPVDLIIAKKWTMMGGAYIATCDSRFARKCEEITDSHFYGAVALHDRCES